MAVNHRITRGDTGGNHHLVKARQGGNIRRHTKAQIDPRRRHLGLVIVNEPPELFLAGDLLGHIQLAANLARFFKNTHLMTAYRKRQRRR